MDRFSKRFLWPSLALALVICAFIAVWHFWPRSSKTGGVVLVEGVGVVQSVDVKNLTARLSVSSWETDVLAHLSELDISFKDAGEDCPPFASIKPGDKVSFRRIYTLGESYEPLQIDSLYVPE